MSKNSELSPRRTTIATLLFIEAAIVLALAGWLIFFSFTHENEEVPALLGEIGFALLGALGLFAAAPVIFRNSYLSYIPAPLRINPRPPAEQNQFHLTMPALLHSHE